MNSSKAFAIAYEEALRSPGVGGNRKSNFRVGACLLDKNNRKIASAFNSYKTHPCLVKLTKYPFQHAEIACLIKGGFDNARNSKLYVVRINKNEEILPSHPCEECMSILRSVGVREINYYALQRTAQQVTFPKTRTGKWRDRASR